MEGASGGDLMARNNSDLIFSVGNTADVRRQIKAALVAIRTDVGPRVLDDRFGTFVGKIAEAEAAFDAAMASDGTETA